MGNLALIKIKYHERNTKQQSKHISIGRKRENGQPGSGQAATTGMTSAPDLATGHFM